MVESVDIVLILHPRLLVCTLFNTTQESWVGKLNVGENGALNTRFVDRTQRDLAFTIHQDELLNMSESHCSNWLLQNSPRLPSYSRGVRESRWDRSATGRIRNRSRAMIFFEQKATLCRWKGRSDHRGLWNRCWNYRRHRQWRQGDEVEFIILPKSFRMVIDVMQASNA